MSWWWTGYTTDCIYSLPCPSMERRRRRSSTLIWYGWYVSKLFGKMQACFTFLIRASWQVGNYYIFHYTEHLQPRDIVRSLYPAYNAFSWFEVTEASHHQVGFHGTCWFRAFIAQDKYSDLLTFFLGWWGSFRGQDPFVGEWMVPW